MKKSFSQSKGAAYKAACEMHRFGVGKDFYAMALCLRAAWTKAGYVKKAAQK